MKKGNANGNVFKMPLPLCDGLIGDLSGDQLNIGGLCHE